jgi:flavin-dependent dehydrogenase
VTTAFDVAVIGGGVAAAAAALTLSGSGLVSCRVNPASAPGDRIGESLSPKANALLAELGLAARFAAGPHRPAHSSYAAWTGPYLAQRHAIAEPDGLGHILDRPAFDGMLEDAARASSVMSIHGEVVAVESRDPWRLVLAGGGTLEARIVIDCTGRRAVFGRRIAAQRRVDRLISAWTLLRQQDAGVEPTPATLIEAAAEGWWYATLLPDRRLALAFFTDPDQLARGLSRDAAAWRRMAAATGFVSKWLQSAGFAADRPPRIAAAGTAWLEPAAGRDWAAAGDAAAAFDPLSSHGITTALWAGRRAAQAAMAALAGNHAPLAAYADTVAVGVGEFLRQRDVIYRSSQHRDEVFWRRRRIVTPETCRT